MPLSEQDRNDLMEFTTRQLEGSGITTTSMEGLLWIFTNIDSISDLPAVRIWLNQERAADRSTLKKDYQEGLADEMGITVEDLKGRLGEL